MKKHGLLVIALAMILGPIGASAADTAASQATNSRRKSFASGE